MRDENASSRTFVSFFPRWNPGSQVRKQDATQVNLSCTYPTQLPLRMGSEPDLIRRTPSNGPRVEPDANLNLLTHLENSGVVTWYQRSGLTNIHDDRR